MISKNNPCVVWRFMDGKPGHESQTRGLVLALQERFAVDCHEIAVIKGWKSIQSLLAGSGQWNRLPKPGLLLGCGHRTHLQLLAARKRFGGRAIVCMKPSLPLSWFDLCLVPEHDQVRESGRVLVTQGPLNTIRPTDRPADPDAGLILLGGPSKHHGWNMDWLLRQISELLCANPAIHWTLSTSRRTPTDTLSALPDGLRSRLNLVDWQHSSVGWLAEKLKECSHVRVTEDSASMIYESLTARALVGVIEVPRLKLGRVASGVDRLVSQGLVFRGAETPASNGPRKILREADRCAELIGKRFLSEALPAADSAA